MRSGTDSHYPRFKPMRAHPFETVTVETKRIGRYRVIASVEEASEYLVYDWPVEKGKLQLDARIACLDCLEGAVSTDAAREAFVAAAKDAGLYVKEGR
ncbi:hypothetical protein QFZ34_002035 [Phyllobacterium ifriqiyense]|uniref:DUF982 domain-containing protein n=1 Tax=Phyllobacterium ifriqiyense TaxID=314238 RepID=A0ABU0S7W6_9HYPH|nr:DUF982 domain-containing protein [Phyllobacterium ifriqiyense]MDQ0996853.1 hypothetical protein [Phyllobacterium ifriqiyense]